MARSKRPLRRRPQETEPVDPADSSLFREAMRRLDVVPKYDAKPTAPETGDVTPIDPVDDDASLFHEAMRQLDVTPKNENKLLRRQASAAKQHPPTKHQPPRSPARPSPTSRSAATESPIDPVDVSLFMRAMRQLDVVPDKESGPPLQSPRGTRRRRAPKAGIQRIDDRLDLHRSRVEDALARLDHFVQRTQRRGNRNIIVITGKGHHSPGGIPVLRRAVEDWILGDGKRFIEGFSDAPRDEGGRGAFLLYLRRPHAS